MSLRTVLLCSIAALCSSTTLYKPASAGNALDAIEGALAQIVNNKHLSAAQLKSAKSVSANVEATVSELESDAGKKLSKEARAAKVTSAIKQLQSLQDEWAKAADAAISQKKADLMKQLKDKEALMAKDEKMLKVLNLEKKLAEKKLALEKLVEMKNAKEQAGAQQEEEKEAAARQEMIANVLKMAASVQSAQGKGASVTHAAAKVIDGKQAMLKTVLDHLEGRMTNVTASIKKIEAAEKKREGEIKETLKISPAGKSDKVDKAASLLKMLMKKEKRQFEKAMAPLKSEYKELSAAVTSIKKGDVSGLSKVMTHMQSEMKTLQAKSHKFLY